MGVRWDRNMKVYFRHSFNDSDSFYTVANAGAVSDDISLEKVTSALKENFESINFIYDYLSGTYSIEKGKSLLTMYFSFKDLSDEAAFLLWSSDGIEI